METDPEEQIDAILIQFKTVLNKNQDTKDTDALTTSKWDIRSSSPFKIAKTLKPI